MLRLLLTAAVRFYGLILLLLGIAMPLRAQAADSVAVLTTVERLFDAMARRDTAAARGLLAPGSRFVSVRGDSAGAAPQVTSDTAFLRSLAVGRARLVGWGDDLTARMVAGFVDAILAGRPVPIDGVDGLRALEVVVAAYRSSELGRPVTIADVRA